MWTDRRKFRVVSTNDFPFVFNSTIRSKVWPHLLTLTQMVDLSWDFFIFLNFSMNFSWQNISFFKFCLGFWAIFTRFLVRCELSDLPKPFSTEIHIFCPIDFINFKGAENVNFCAKRFGQVRFYKKKTLIWWN